MEFDDMASEYAYIIQQLAAAGAITINVDSDTLYQEICAVQSEMQIDE